MVKFYGYAMKLSNDQCAVSMLEAGVNQAVVAREFGVHRSTISRLQSKFHETITVADRPRAGRPRVTTLRQDRTIRLMHMQTTLRQQHELHQRFLDVTDQWLAGIRYFCEALEFVAIVPL